MITTNDYMHVPYVANGRTMEGMDCWGLVRHVWSNIYGKQSLPPYDGVAPSDKRSLTRSSEDCIESMRLRDVPFNEGAIACGYQGSICVHVGIVVKADGRMWILETDEKHGVSLTERRVFDNRFTKVTYHDC